MSGHTSDLMAAVRDLYPHDLGLRGCGVWLRESNPRFAMGAVKALRMRHVGFQNCRKVNACPRCADYRSRRLVGRLTRILATWAGHGDWLHVTLDMPWEKNLAASGAFKKFKGVKETFMASRQLAEILGPDYAGSVTATELVYSPDSGWGPHQHLPFAVPKQSQSSRALVSKELRMLWKACLRANGFKDDALERSINVRLVGVEPQDYLRIAKYLAKGLQAASRSAGPSLSRFQLLREFVTTGEIEQADRYKDAVAALKHSPPMLVSRKLNQTLKALPAKTAAVSTS